jgi:hypothetical protein
MIKFQAHTFFAIANSLELIRASAAWIGRFGSGAFPDILAEAEPAILRALKEHCTYAGLESPQPHIDRMLEMYEGKYGEYPLKQLEADYRELHLRIQDEMETLLVMRIPKNRAEYFEKIEAFGSDVAASFPSAYYDIEEAGNCYATDRNTACVFHSMRVLEIGLRVLASDLSVSFPTPIELENWNTIIEKIEAEIRERNKLPKGTKKSDDLQFYSEAAKEFRYFKDAWRNHVSHSREKYGDAEAYRVLTHVKDFMQHLATRLKE